MRFAALPYNALRVILKYRHCHIICQQICLEPVVDHIDRRILFLDQIDEKVLINRLHPLKKHCPRYLNIGIFLSPKGFELVFVLSVNRIRVSLDKLFDLFHKFHNKISLSVK